LPQRPVVKLEPAPERWPGLDLASCGHQVGALSITPQPGMADQIMRLRNKAVSMLRRMLKPGDAVDPYAYFSCLWRGHSGYGLARLRAEARNPLRDEWVRAECAWILAQYHTAHGDLTRAAAAVSMAIRVCPPVAQQKRLHIAAPYIFALAGREQSARDFIARYWEGGGGGSDALMLMASLPGVSEAERLNLLNHMFERAGLTPLEKLDPSGDLALHNLAAGKGSPAANAGGEPKISVFMPAFNAAETIVYAVRSVLAQSWSNLELIIIDDGSTDDTARIAGDLAGKDRRIRLIQPGNRLGAYGARNVGIEVMDGEYFTTHDADDWSHPQKLEIQMASLRRSNSLASWSPWVRCDPALRIRFSFMPQESFMQPNYSSLLYHRSVIENIGMWDMVRVEGDNEFISRLKAKYSDSVLAQTDVAAPLSFGLKREGSLTRQSDTHIFTYFHGLRRAYREIYQHLHTHHAEEVCAGALMPSSLLAPISNQASARALDVVVIGHMAEGAADESIAMIDALGARGLKLGVFNYLSRDSDAALPMDAGVIERAVNGICEILAPAEYVHSAHVILVAGRTYLAGIDRPLVISGASAILCPDSQPSQRLPSRLMGLPVRRVGSLAELDFTPRDKPNSSMV